MLQPKISVITINFNGERHLEQTISSVVDQTYPNVEYIIIDGASSDRSLNIIEQYANKISVFISESDLGIADAMNKGLKLSSGDLILFLHSDDYLTDESALENAINETDQKHEIFAYPIKYGNTKISRLMHPRGFNPWINLKTGVFHQSTICKKKVFQQVGLFDTNFSIAMDYDFFLRAYRDRCKMKLCSTEFVFMRDSGISSQIDRASLTLRFDEEQRVHLKNCRSLLLKSAYSLYWPIYRFYRSLL